MNLDSTKQIPNLQERSEVSITSSSVPNSVCVENPLVSTQLSESNNSSESVWPRQVDLFGVPVSVTSYEEATSAIIKAAKKREGGLVSCHAVHAIVTFCRDKILREKINSFDMITPDGQPVRWALNLLHGVGLKKRVYGPELTLRVCQAAAESETSVYLYGGSSDVINKLQKKLLEKFPQLKIAGAESPPFRELTLEEDQEAISRINDSGAGILLIGLGCPKQDLFAYEHRNTLKPVQLCVGAAFDFHAGVKAKAPRWMQDRGLEWLFRLCCEPRRLWKRYLMTNSEFVTRLVLSLLDYKKVRSQKNETRIHSLEK